MRRLLSVALLLVAPAVARAAPNVVSSAKSGNWSDGATWAGGKAPAAGEKVLVRTGHTVVYDATSDAVIRSVHVSGTLVFATDRDTLLNTGLIKIQAGDTTDETGFDCEAHVKPPKDGEPRPALVVGTPDAPVIKRAVIRLHYIDGMDKESCPAVVCCGGRMDFHGAPMPRTWVKLGATATGAKGGKGDAKLTPAEPVPGWKPGDRVVVTGTAGYNAKVPTEERSVAAASGNELTLTTGLDYTHAVAEDRAGEVANLTRNVVVESADPDGVRGHTMYHKHSTGGISYAEFRHLGKRDVLGRYALHFHLCGDTMRGSSVIGASVWDSHNRWLTVHGTQYLVVRDCVGYKSVGHGFFLEDGTEVYNVLDRNLAVAARHGKPLPKQLLPFDPNDGAGFWWANSLNAFTRNVAADCDGYGFRFEATPQDAPSRAPGGEGRARDRGKPFDLALPVRQPDGTAKKVDVRTLPFVRFEGNEAHNIRGWGLNLGEFVGGVGPDAAHPFVLRDTKIWTCGKGYTVHSPCVLIDGMTITETVYGVWGSEYRKQDYRNVTLARVRKDQNGGMGWSNSSGAPVNADGQTRVRLPGQSGETKGDGGNRVLPAAEEKAVLTPVDDLPPQTVVTHVAKKDGKLVVRGTCSDNGEVKSVTVNGVAARATVGNFAQWEAELPAAGAKLTAGAADAAGNVEKTPHVVAVGR